MQAIMETAFDVVYLVTVITLGVRMIAGCRGEEQFRLFGIMAVVLGAGDAFHLVPRRWLCVPPGWRTTRRRWELESGSPPSP